MTPKATRTTKATTAMTEGFMTRFLRTVLLSAALLGSAAPAFAQHPAERPGHGAEGVAPVGAAAPGEHESGGHGEHHGIDPKRLAFQLLNFALLVGILVKFGGGAINKSLRARHEQLKADLQEAATARAAAEARLKEQDRRVANLEAELVTLRASLAQAGEHEKSRLVAAAEERVRRIQDETRAMLDQQVRDAERRFREEVATAAMRIAEEKVRRSLQTDDEARLLQSFVQELEAGTPVSSGRAA